MALKKERDRKNEIMPCDVICVGDDADALGGKWFLSRRESRHGALLCLSDDENISCENLCRSAELRAFCACNNSISQSLDYLEKKGYERESIILFLRKGEKDQLNEISCEKDISLGGIIFAFSCDDGDVKKANTASVPTLVLGCEREEESFLRINKFLDSTRARKKGPSWLRLDNAAKIYPAARHRNWSNVYRLSVTMKEEVCKESLQSALDICARRFPSVSVRLRRGFFWYYLEQLPSPPEIREEKSYPITRMTNAEMGKCALRVIVHKKRIALEFFHSITDGTSALTFLKTLLCEYVCRRYGVSVPDEKGILSRTSPPKKEELEDSFLKHAAPVSASRKENTAWHLSGEREMGGFQHVTCFYAPVSKLIERAHHYNVSLTAYLCAVMMKAILDLQAKKVPKRKKRKPVRVLIPINLRNLFESKTLRNFALYTTPEADPRLGDYSMKELCSIAHHRIALEATAKCMGARIATNVSSEKSLAVKLMPLFIKNAVMKAVFMAVGERKSCLSLSNLGRVDLPDALCSYVERFDFVLGVQASAPHNCGVISFGDNIYINIIRNIKKPDLEMAFWEVLRDEGVKMKVESNSSNKPGGE